MLRWVLAVALAFATTAAPCQKTVFACPGPMRGPYIGHADPRASEVADLANLRNLLHTQSVVMQDIEKWRGHERAFVEEKWGGRILIDDYTGQHYTLAFASDRDGSTAFLQAAIARREARLAELSAFTTAYMAEIGVTDTQAAAERLDALWEELGPPIWRQALESVQIMLLEFEYVSENYDREDHPEAHFVLTIHFTNSSAVPIKALSGYLRLYHKGLFPITVVHVKQDGLLQPGQSAVVKYTLEYDHFSDKSAHDELRTLYVEQLEAVWVPRFFRLGNGQFIELDIDEDVAKLL